MMHNYLCWDPRSVRQVINPFAEHITDSLFRAVHSDWDLKVTSQVGTSFQDISEASWVEMTPPAFLEDFLRKDRPHALAAILGKTGSGKSHLVHWMRLNIKPSNERVVLVVRKSGTSLRNIVKMIIAELPEEQQGSFLEILHSAGDGNQSREDQKQQLLNDLAQVIREEVLPPEADEAETELVSCLPNLFQDPYMRQAHFLADNTVIADIVDHIFAPSNAENRPDQRRIFTETDLPLGGMDFALASRLARDAINVIELDPAVNLALAVKIINRNLDRAVARTLSFSGDRVEELMTRLRSYLKAQGKELILLVEEFARLQGIDRALLQAITSQGDERLCRMRTAIAVTTGFFQSVAETAYMRTTHIVDMDHSAGCANGRAVTQASLCQFTSRYLNAVRLGHDRIVQWNNGAMPGETPPSRCDGCVHRVECHEVFGESDGYGLYPFTKQSLWNSAERADHSMPEQLNPRVLQNDLLVEVLDNFGPNIKLGTFPPFRLLEKLGGIKKLPAVVQAELQNRNPSNYHRWAAFLELYDGTGQIVNLDERLRAAFDVPKIPNAADAKPVEPLIETPSVEAVPGVQASREDIFIEQWVGGKGLDERVAQKLRELLFSAISNAIDWDMIGLAKGAFVGRTQKAFMRTSIAFDRQTTQARSDLLVKIVIPGDLVQPATAAAALQGVLRASKNQFKWDFPNGEKMLSAFLDCVDIWTKSVVAQLQHICQPTPQWNQAAAAIELLCVGAAIAGKIKPNATITDMIEAVFSSNWASECASTAPEMKSLYNKILKNREKLFNIAHSQVSTMKGGRVGAMLNPSKIIEPIRAFRHAKWHLLLQPPEDVMQEPAKIYREICSLLPKAAEAEMVIRQSWLATMDDAFGVTANRAKIVSILEAAQQAVAEAGIGSGNTSPQLGKALERFKTVQFDDSISAARSLTNEKDAIAALPQLGRGRQGAVEAGTELVKAANTFLNIVDQNIGSVSESLEAKRSAVTASLQQIDTSLGAIEVDLVALSHTQGEIIDAT
ncbi:protein DpdH [Novacetimonas pomaceti]|uniref:protein DpdH n=1 Tax=Novacetimonas pomaceti TaxID=2021998 RepID=UPI001057A6A6|nr:protein DpdH [Novacetimonas pomaceti]